MVHPAKPDYWSHEVSPEQHYYRVVPLKNHKPVTVSDPRWVECYTVLGELGYRFVDGGHDATKIIISLDKPFSPKHRVELSDRFSIRGDSGTELHFC